MDTGASSYAPNGSATIVGDTQVNQITMLIIMFKSCGMKLWNTDKNVWRLWPVNVNHHVFPFNPRTFPRNNNAFLILWILKLFVVVCVSTKHTGVFWNCIPSLTKSHYFDDFRTSHWSWSCFSQGLKMGSCPISPKDGEVELEKPSFGETPGGISLPQKDL